MRVAALAVLVAAALACASAGAQRLNKCVDDKGRVTFSDTMCPVVNETPRPAAPVSHKVSGKLNEATVEKLIRHAATLAVQGDFQAQCALAAKDISFQIADHSVTPPLVIKGGRAQLCALQRDGAEGMREAQLVPSHRLGKLNILVNAEGTQGAVRYESVTTLKRGGQTVLVNRCQREETLRVYGGDLLYSGLTAVCRPT